MLARALPLVSVVDRFSQLRYRQISKWILKRSGVSIEGLPLWISPRTYFDISEPGSITLGDRCVISHYVRLLTHDYSLDRVAESRLGVSQNEYFNCSPIEIGSGAFVGMNVLVMPGVTIGSGAIIGSGSVVTKNVPSDTVWAGNPAKQIATTDALWERNLDKYVIKKRRK